MNCLTNEADYVLGVLYQIRDRVIARPNLFDRNALELIDREIARKEELLQEFEAA